MGHTLLTWHVDVAVGPTSGSHLADVAGGSHLGDVAVGPTSGAENVDVAAWRGSGSHNADVAC